MGGDFPVVHHTGPVVCHGAHGRAGVLRRGAWPVRPWGKSSRHSLAARARSDNLRLKRRRRAQRKQSLRPLFSCSARTQDALSTRRHFTPELVEKLREDCPVYGACRSAFYNCRNYRQIQPLKHALFSTAFHAIYQEKSPWLPPLYASGAKKAKGHKGD